MIAVAALRLGALLPALPVHALAAGGPLAVRPRRAAGTALTAAAMLALTLAVAPMLGLAGLTVTLVLPTLAVTLVLAVLAVALRRRLLLRGGGGGDGDGKSRNDVLHDENS